jgi:hypothetical protein
MLYAGCGNCGAVVPLLCGGQFMPHMPMYAEAGPMGIFCRCCGPKQPVFTCTLCGMMQMLYLPGAGIAPQMMQPGGRQVVAPVVNAQSGAGGNEIKNLLMSAGKSFFSEFAKHMGGQLADQFGQSKSNFTSNWFGNDGGWPGSGQAW